MLENSPDVLVLVIDADPVARAAVRQAAQRLHWQVLEAADGLTGIELLRRYDGEIELVVLAVDLPDLDGYDTCLRLRAITRHRAVPLPILPFAASIEAEPFLSALGCVPTLLKPASTDEIEQALREAMTGSHHPSPPSPLLAYAYRKANVTEQLVRQHRGHQPRIVLFAPSQIVRAGLAHTLRTSGAMVVAETNSVHVLTTVLTHAAQRILVSDAEGGDLASTLAQEHGVPLLLLAASEQQRQLLLRDEDMVGMADGVVDVSTDQGVRMLPEAFAAIQAGRRFVCLNTTAGREVEQVSTIPSHIVTHFASTPLTRRLLELLWLDYQGWSTADIARRLTVTEATVQSYWKRLQRKMHRTRGEVRTWFRQKLAAIQFHDDHLVR